MHLVGCWPTTVSIWKCHFEAVTERFDTLAKWKSCKNMKEHHHSEIMAFFKDLMEIPMAWPGAAIPQRTRIQSFEVWISNLSWWISIGDFFYRCKWRCFMGNCGDFFVDFAKMRISWGYFTIVVMELRFRLR